MPPEYEMRIRNLMMAKYLQQAGHKVKIFSASTIHNTDINLIKEKSTLFIEKKYEDFEFVHIRTRDYKGNGLSRIINMLQFPFRLKKVAKKIEFIPDVIICDLGAILAPIPYFISKKNKAKFILEVRDLWPESFVAYGIISKKNPLLSILYKIEKWIYEKADKVIFTMEGGKDYIIEKGWDKDNGGKIDIGKVYHINNGVDLNTFEYNKDNFQIDDRDLMDPTTFKVVYAGSIRLVNNVRSVIDAAEKIKKKGIKNIKFIIFGEGDDKKSLVEYCKKQNIDNVIFKGFVDKKYIPYILSKSDLNIMHFQQNNLKKYGASLNKMFEYFASGKPTLSDCEFGYDIIKKYHCGIVIDNANAEQLAEKIIEISNIPEKEYQDYCKNALIAANDYDFKNLTNKLLDVLED